MTESPNTNNNYNSNSSNNSLIKVCVNFDIQRIGMDSETPLLSDTKESNTNSDFNIVNITLGINDDIPKFIQSLYNGNNNTVTDGINNMKDCLKSTMNKLFEMIDFFKEKLAGKKLLIRTLTLQEANDGNLVNKYSNETVIDTKEVIINDTVSNSITTGNDGLYENISSALLVDETNKSHLPESRPFNARGNVRGNITNSKHIPMNVRTLNMLKKDTDIEEVHKWPKNTILIVGDSIINGIEESRIKKTIPVKVRSYQGAKISDMYDY